LSYFCCRTPVESSMFSYIKYRSSSETLTFRKS